MNSSKSARRRKQHGRAPSSNNHQTRRRKHKKPPPSNDFSIEEQLRAQRKKRALESKTSSSASTTQQQQQQQQPKSLGNYRYDAERNAYFPQDSFPTKENKKHSVNAVKKKQSLQCNYMQCAHAKRIPMNTGALSSQSLHYSMDISSSPTRQHHLRSILAAKLLRMNMQVVPTVVPLMDATRLLCMMPPLLSTDTSTSISSDSTTALDFCCKSRLHASARTFDIAMDCQQQCLPSIANLVDGGSQVTFGHVPRVWTVGNEPPQPSHFDDVTLRISPLADSGESEPHAIRFAPCDCQNPSRYSFASICKTQQSQHKSVVRLWCGDEDSIRHGNFFLPFIANDLSFDPKETQQLRTSGLIGVAANCKKEGGSRLCLLDIASESYSNFREDAPKSDALTIERDSDRFYTGHRNGWLSVVDLRSDSADSFAPGDASAGSLTKILVMDDVNKILTRHSFGSCFLWDVRMMGKGGATNKATPLLHLKVPRSMIHPTKTSCCNGVAVDPTQSIAIAPIVSDEGQTCLAFWSLSSGSFVGSKELCSPEWVRSETASGDDVGGGMPHCELSSTITPAWKPIPSLTTTRDGDLVEPNEDAWGLWFKFGSSPTGRLAPNFISSIHHVTFPGRMMDGDCESTPSISDHAADVQH